MPDDLTPIQIPDRIFQEVYAEARKSFPFECCGWLAGSNGSSEVSIVRACYNAQDGGQHPIASERTSERAYVIEGEDAEELDQSFDSETPALIIYHSHPNGRAYLSEIDRAVATNPWDGGPMFPVQHLVVGINEERVVESALFAWSDDEEGFVEIARYQGAEV